MVESVAVVLVSFNAKAHLLRAIGSVRDAADIVVIDNASSDGSVEAVRRLFPFVTILPQARNVGFGCAVNAGVSQTRSPYILLLNPDAQLPAGGLLSLVAAYRRAEATFGRIGALAARHVEASGALQLSVGPAPSLMNEALRKCCQQALDQENTLPATLVEHALKFVLRRRQVVPWASASCLLLQRQDFLQIGGFDPRFFLYFEDVDLCLRLARSGRPVVFDPSITVTHHRGRSAAHAPTLARRAYRQGQMLCARRWQRPFGAWMVEQLAQRRARGL